MSENLSYMITLKAFNMILSQACASVLSHTCKSGHRGAKTDGCCVSISGKIKAATIPWVGVARTGVFPGRHQMYSKSSIIGQN